MEYIFFIQFLVAVCLSACAKNGLRKVSSLVMVLSFLLISVQFISYLAMDYFTGNGFDDSVMFHLAYGLGGAGFTSYLHYMILIVAGLLGAIGASAILFKRTKSEVNSLKGFVILSFMVSSAFLNPLTYDFGTYFYKRSVVGSDVEFEEKFRQVNNFEVSNKKNLIFVYLESFEQGYLDNRIFPNLTPNLKKLSSEGYRLTNLDQSWGSGWTIAGIVASQCGFPLPTLGKQGNTLGQIVSFLPGANCMGDILSRHGYDLSFIGGAKLDFAGKGKFFKTHSFNTVLGKKELARILSLERKDMNHWGIYDDDLFDYALKHIEELENKKNQYATFLLTVDTHHPKGHISKSCKDIHYSEISENEMLRSIKCSDFLIGKFVDKLSRIVNMNETIIVLASDHLAMNNDASELLDKGQRRNLFLMLNSGLKGSNDRLGYTYDIAPTIFPLLGFEIREMGFGRDLVTAKMKPFGPNETENLEKKLARFW